MDTKCNNDDQITISRAIMTFVFRNTLLRVNFFCSLLSSYRKFQIQTNTQFHPLFRYCFCFALHTQCACVRHRLVNKTYVQLVIMYELNVYYDTLGRKICCCVHYFLRQSFIILEFVFVQCNFIQQDKENEKFHAIFFRVREKRARHLAQTKRAETNKIAHHKFTDHHEKTPVAAKQAPLA